MIDPSRLLAATLLVIALGCLAASISGYIALAIGVAVHQIRLDNALICAGFAMTAWGRVLTEILNFCNVQRED